MTIHVKAKAPLARRCRCGYCFDAEGQELVVSDEELAVLKADPMLVVTEIEAPEPAPNADDDRAAPEEPGNTDPEGDMPEGEAHASAIAAKEAAHGDNK